MQRANVITLPVAMLNTSGVVWGARNIQTVRQDANFTEGEYDMKCPICGEEMDLIVVGGYYIEQCPECGNWEDAK